MVCHLVSTLGNTAEPPPSAKTTKIIVPFVSNGRQYERRTVLITGKESREVVREPPLDPASTITTIADVAAMRRYPRVLGTVGELRPPPGLKGNDPPVVSRPESPLFVAERANRRLRLRRRRQYQLWTRCAFPRHQEAHSFAKAPSRLLTFRHII